MNWSIAWSIVAERDLLSLPWRLAARVDAAIMAFAEGRGGEGLVERMSASDPYRLRLRLRGASAFLWLDAGARVVNVARVLRTM
jgi:hypothetical protein